jgi:hypothetical protein
MSEQLAMQPKPITNCVPGKVHCAKCGFTLVRTNLYVNSGTAGPGGEETEPCPNDGNPMLPVTWEREAREGWKLNEQLFDRAIAAEKKVAAQSRFGLTPRQHLESAIKWIDERRARLHATHCSIHQPSARCSCGLHRTLCDLYALRDVLPDTGTGDAAVADASDSEGGEL